MTSQQAMPVPTEIGRAPARPSSEPGRANDCDVKIRWQDGHESIYPARELRLACPCAGCVDEITGHVRVIASSIAQTVRPVKIDLIGRYAISITWSDGHNTGIYSFDKLRKLCPCCSSTKHPAPSTK